MRFRHGMVLGTFGIFGLTLCSETGDEADDES